MRKEQAIVPASMGTNLDREEVTPTHQCVGSQARGPSQDFITNTNDHGRLILLDIGYHPIAAAFDFNGSLIPGALSDIARSDFIVHEVLAELLINFITHFSTPMLTHAVIVGVRGSSK
jgi:hypothetical protein